MIVGGEYSNTTGSFQSQPPTSSASTIQEATVPPRKKIQGIASVLRDTTNQQVRREGTRGRESKLMAQEWLKSSSATMRPRRDSALGANTRWTSSMQKGESEHSDTDRPVRTLKQVIQHCPEQFERGASYIDDFVERDVSPEILKA